MKVDVPVPDNRTVTRSDLHGFKEKLESEWPELIKLLQDLDEEDSGNNFIDTEQHESVEVVVPKELETFYTDFSNALGTDMGEAVSIALFIEDLNNLAVILRDAGNLFIQE